MRSFFEEVPVELEEAVFIDGGSRLQAFWHVTMPLAAAGSGRDVGLLHHRRVG